MLNHQQSLSYTHPTLLSWPQNGLKKLTDLGKFVRIQQSFKIRQDQIIINSSKRIVFCH